jgi:hypothetical protein
MWSERQDCPKCGLFTLERETWLSTQDFREECCECGYFREASYGYRVAGQLGLLGEELRILDQEKLLEALKQMHFCIATYPCVREGFIRKSEATKGQYHIIGTWFSSPSDLEAEEVDIDWIEAHIESGLTLDEAEKDQLEKFIQIIVPGCYPGIEVETVHIHERLPLAGESSESGSANPLGIMIVVPPSQATIGQLDTDFTGRSAPLESILQTHLGRPVFVLVRSSGRSEGRP